ncbi:dipeptide epimerase [Candidatus Poribacteria bacterium]|nr:dipeptide epimerase [Candidatus Poribacteria bacterium]MBT5533080.1 dipeptide epimerase [Candidatus Poribacteria bacterium]MBT5709572.1 dipeptide epimerase [Candidatus Poribacteria bacterium]MBT7098567.1 dipeptide epimerase [Candidatus Poribacteria bacterium]
MEHDVVTLRLTHPFRIARTGADDVRQVVHVRVGDGIGEAAPHPYYGESVDTVRVAVDRYAAALRDLPDDAPVERAMRLVDASFGGNASARAALESALWDAMARRYAAPLWRLWGADPAEMPPTSFTIGIGSPEEMQRKATEAADYSILKVKLGTPRDRDIIAALRDVTDKPVRVDANTAWTPKEAVRACEWLADSGVELVEQPVKAADLDGMRFVRERSPLPIIADESVRTAADVTQLAGRVDGINIKLAKCGGPTEALSMIRLARVHGLQVMVGCMIESSVGIATMAQLAPLVDYVDLDGNLLIDNDPYRGPPIADGVLALQDAPGNGCSAV